MAAAPVHRRLRLLQSGGFVGWGGGGINLGFRVQGFGVWGFGLRGM